MPPALIILVLVPAVGLPFEMEWEQSVWELHWMQQVMVVVLSGVLSVVLAFLVVPPRTQCRSSFWTFRIK